MSRRDALLFAWVRRRTKGGWVSLWVVTAILWWWTRTSGRPEEEGWHRMDRMGASVARKSLQAAAAAAAAAAFEPCRPSARRALAARGASASDSDSDWQVMAHCVVQRQAHAVGHFALHVSKSGGTSLCRVFQTHCRTNPNVKENCNYRNMGFSPQWYRRHDPAMHDLSMPTWAMLRPHLYHDLECGELASFVRDRRIHALMSENTIPYDNYGDDDHLSPTTSTTTTATSTSTATAPQVHRHRHRHHDRPLCPQFINSIVMREPMKRLLSHYKQLLGDCHGSSLQPLKCLDAMMTQEDDSTAPRISGLPNKIFDVERMTQLFDIVSDNYYTRSLSPKEVFGWNATLQEHPLGQNAIYSSALKALQSFDWVLLLDSPRMMQKSDNHTTSVMVGDTDEEEEDNDTLRNTLMLQQGLGLGPTVTLGHSRKAHQFSSSSSSSNSGPTVSDPLQLQQRQSLDYRLWNEAQKLHDLDMESLRRMKPYFLDARTRATLLVNNSRGSSSRGAELSDSCCGDICL